MTDHALATEDEARDLLGSDAFEEAFTDGTLRRVVADNGVRYFLGADIDRVAREQDPRHLAALVKGEADDSDDGPRALAERQRRL